MKLVLTVDVEEPGLFRDRYSRRPPGPPDLAGLGRLAALAAEFGLPLTLLATYPVLVDTAAAATLAELSERHGAELGAHLHPWNTPPFETNSRSLNANWSARLGGKAPFPGVGAGANRATASALAAFRESGAAVGAPGAKAPVSPGKTTLFPGRWRSKPGMALISTSDGLPWPEPVLADRLPRELLRAKLESLTSAFRRAVGRSPASFRMGRFDWSRRVLAELPGLGISVEASLAPWVFGLSLTGPADPFALPSGLLEVPLTGRPVWPGLARAVEGVARRLGPAAGRRLRRGFLKIGWAGLAVAWYPLASLKLAARLHRRRGGRVLVLFLHSGELVPGEHPRFPDSSAVERTLRKVRLFLAWLGGEAEIQGTTLADLQGAGFAPGELDPRWWSLAQD